MRISSGWVENDCKKVLVQNRGIIVECKGQKDFVVVLKANLLIWEQEKKKGALL